VFTADVVVDAQRKAKDLGVAGYINKPLEFTILLDQIVKAL
jgi:hypothetical protein